MSSSELLPLLSTAFIVISAVLVAIGWIYIRQGKRETHKRTMIMAAVAALIFFVVYMGRTLFNGNTAWGGPDALKPYYLTFLLFHIVLATVAAVFGLVTLTLAFRERFERHRKMGRMTAVIWFFTAITGVTVYVLLYVLYPGGHTKPLIDAIFG
jgi:putative membrane protein